MAKQDLKPRCRNSRAPIVSYETMTKKRWRPPPKQFIDNKLYTLIYPTQLKVGCANRQNLSNLRVYELIHELL